jgi:putative tricarboxylic transport membrane protein
MSPLEGLQLGFDAALGIELLLAAFMGALLGTLIGVLPGLGPVAGAALVLPLTFSLSPAAGLTVIAAVYAGSMYGGSTTSVLMNIPGEASSVVAAIDGYQMTKRGRAGAALSIMAVGSFIAGTVSLVLVSFFAPVVSKSALAFGPAESFALTAGGLLLLARLAGGSLASGLLPMAFGLLLGTVGQEAVSGTYRYVYGADSLVLGISLVPVAVGLFGISELVIALQNRVKGSRPPQAPALRELMPTRQEWKRSLAPWGRGSLLGFGFGLLPGPSGTLSSFASYRLEKAVSKHRKELGTGAVEGIAGPEAANNAASISSLVPVLSLGIPFSATLAVMISAMMIQGVPPGPLLISQNPEVFWGVIAAMYIANVMLLVLNLPLVGVWVSILRIPQTYLMPGIVVVSVIGAYSVRNSMLDVYVLLGAAAVGYVMRKLGLSLASLVVGLVLGPLIEKHLREGLFLSNGEIGYFVSTPLSLSIWAVVVLVTFATAIAAILRRRPHPPLDGPPPAAAAGPVTGSPGSPEPRADAPEALAATDHSR